MNEAAAERDVMEYDVVPVGAATRGSSRPIGERSRLYLAMERMDHILHLDETSLVVHAPRISLSTNRSEILPERSWPSRQVPL